MAKGKKSHKNKKLNYKKSKAFWFVLLIFFLLVVVIVWLLFVGADTQRDKVKYEKLSKDIDVISNLIDTDFPAYSKKKIERCSYSSAKLGKGSLGCFVGAKQEIFFRDKKSAIEAVRKTVKSVDSLPEYNKNFEESLKNQEPQIYKSDYEFSGIKDVSCGIDAWVEETEKYVDMKNIKLILITSCKGAAKAEHYDLGLYTF